MRVCSIFNESSYASRFHASLVPKFPFKDIAQINTGEKSEKQK